MSTENKNILIVTGLYPPDIGGTATYSKLLHDELAGRGVSVSVLSFGTVRHLPLGVRHLVFFFKILKAGRRRNILYAQDTMSVGWPTLCANLFLQKTFIVRVPGDHVWEQARQRFGVTESLEEFSDRRWVHPYLLFLRGLRWCVVRFADAVVTPSNYFAGVVKKWSRKANIVTIYNGIEIPDISFPDTTLHEELGISDSDVVLVSVGRLVPWKGFRGLFPVVRRLREEGIHVHLVVVGDGPLRHTLLQEASNQGVSDQVTFTGGVAREKLYTYLSAADAFILNTHFESFSFQTVEAMMLSTPVITTNIGSLPELITDGVEGILVTPDNTKGFVEAVKRISGDEALRKALTKKAKKRARQFSIKNTTDQLIKLIATS